MAFDISKLVNDYIDGKDIKEYSIEQLENNKYFMEKVLDTSNDYKMYHYCSDKVKTDTGFIRFLIKKFNNNLNFLCNAVDYYSEHTNDNDNIIEISIIMRDLLKANNDERFYKYELMRDVLYTALRLQVEHAKYFEKEDYKFQSDTGLGFWYIFDLYKNNRIVTDFYAKKMLHELFVEDYYALDKILHKQYSSLEELENKGIYNALIDVVRIYDEMLSDYLCVNKELLKEVIYKYKHVAKRWDKYVDVNESNRFDILGGQLEDYFKDKEEMGVLSEREIVTIAGMKYGIEEKLVQFQIIDTLDIDIVNENKKNYKEVLKHSFLDKMYYRNIKNIIKSNLFSNEQVEEINEKKCKVLNLENYRKPINREKTRQK